VVADAAEVLKDIFDEAERRDPTHQRTWVALVDGNNHQIDRVKVESASRGIDVAVIIDFIHVLEYLWAAAWCFFAEADPAAEDWVRDRALAVLEGGATTVAAGLRRRASTQRLSAQKRKKADQAADTWSTRRTTSTTRRRWPPAGRSPPALSKVHSDTS
jgi:hypothetical protein